MVQKNIIWISYNLISCFAVYWLSNVILWYPWSINEKIGQIIMLTINPLLWGFVSYVCIKKYPNQKMCKGILLNGIMFSFGAIISDLIFFGIIRKSMDKLMHITTIYSWIFVFVLPFIVYIIFRKHLNRNRMEIMKSDFLLPIGVGIICLLIIIAIVIFNIRFDRINKT
jgi:hypothetical protein